MRTIDSQVSSGLPSQAPWMQGLQTSASKASSGGSGAPHTLQQRPWEHQLPADSRSDDSLVGSNTGPSTPEIDTGPTATGVGTNSLAPGKLSLLRPFSGHLQPAATDKDKDAEVNVESLHATVSAAWQGVCQTTPKQETLLSLAEPAGSQPAGAASLYGIFTPGQLRHGVQPLAHTASHGAPPQEAATLGEAPTGIAKSGAAETPAELEAEPGPQLRGVPCSRAAAAGIEPEWLHDDLDEMLPDGMSGPTWNFQPPLVSRASLMRGTSAAATGGTAAGTRDAAGPAIVNPTDVSTASGRSAVIQNLRSTATSVEHDATSVLAGARPASTLKGASSTAAAVECPSSPVGNAQGGGSAAVDDRVHSTCHPLSDRKVLVELLGSPVIGQERAAGLGVAAALTTATPGSSQDADRGGSAVTVSTQAALNGKAGGLAPLTSILAKQGSAGGSSTGAPVKGGPEQVHGGALEANVLSQQKKRGSDVIWQPSSIVREDRCTILDDRFQAACGRCAELNAELAAKDAAARLVRSENAELAARCERLERHLAEARAAAQLISFEQSGLKERCAILEKEAAGHAATIDAVNDERDKARSKCDTLEEISAERETCLEKAVADSIQSRARCEKLEQTVQEVCEEGVST